MAKFLQGVYKPQHPEKYKGNVKNIVYRSSYELTYMRKLDSDPTVIQWASEENVVPYHDPVTGRVRRYFLDFYVKKKDSEGVITEHLIEIKPYSQTIEPKKTPRKREKTFLREVTTYVTNDAKWKAAKTYCEKKGWHFHILTEKDLGVWGKK